MYDKIFVRWSLPTHDDTRSDNLFMCKGVEAAYDALKLSYDDGKWVTGSLPTLVLYDFSDTEFMEFKARDEDDRVKHLVGSTSAEIERLQEAKMSEIAVANGKGGWAAKYNTNLPVEEFVFIQNTPELKDKAKDCKLTDDKARKLIDAYIRDIYEYLRQLVDIWEKDIDKNVIKHNVKPSGYYPDHVRNTLDCYKRTKLPREQYYQQRNEDILKILVGGRRSMDGFKQFAEELWETCRTVKLISKYSSVLQRDAKDAEPRKFFAKFAPTDPEAPSAEYTTIFREDAFAGTFLKHFPRLRF